MYWQKKLPSPLGILTLLADERAICGLWMEGQRYFCRGYEGIALCQGTVPPIEEAERWLRLFFAGRNPGELPPLCPVGTPFQRAVWQELLTIKKGQCISYGALAKGLALRLQREAPSPRAVGQAVGKNPIAILIPCHRVVGAGGGLTGYAGGLQRKQWLLDLEKAALAGQDAPEQRTPL